MNRTSILKKLSAFAIATTAAVAFNSAVAATGTITAPVDRIMFDNDLYGACVAHFPAHNPKSVLPGCADNWITFDCDAQFNDENKAYEMFSLVQMAFALNKRVRITFTDEQTHNGWCVAKRVQLLP